MITEARLDEIKARCAEADGGPWRVVEHEVYGEVEVQDERDHSWENIQTAYGWPALLRLAAAARTDVPELVAEVERLQNNPVMLTMLREAKERVADLEADAQRMKGLIQLLIGPRLRDIPASVMDLINKELGT